VTARRTSGSWSATGADATQPYVWADVRGDDVTGSLVILSVGNSGPAIATNARITIDPPLPSVPELRNRAEAAQRRLADGITLPPGRIITWPLGQGSSLLNGDGPQRHTFTISAEGPDGPLPQLTYTLDLADWRRALARPSGTPASLRPSRN